MNANIFKHITIVCLLAALIFWLGKLYSYNNSLPVDGNLSYGFPLTYYVQASGMDMDVPYEDLQHTYYDNLAIDVLFALIVAMALTRLYVITKKRFFK